MTQSLSWEKAQVAGKLRSGVSARARLATVGVILMGAMIVALLIATLTTGRFFISVNDLLSRPELVGRTVRITGAVVGETIRFDPETQTISFTVAHVTDKISELEALGGLARALHLAVTDPNANRLPVIVRNQPMPDLLQNEAQAIMTGRLSSDGVFYADELQLKCPSRYESAVPDQAE
ncbi:MAG: cytochrome c maturation protein CcmE [Anaerolineae bacterium]|nr:cytochrome c maturation protein CcmE [Anaerolineae bacterium]MDW8300162.1 cytochrome c maturation protein CcmE [Anaerolineae bacterium]